MNHDVTEFAEVSAAQALEQIEQLVRFALKQQLIAPLDESFARNALLDLFRFAEPVEAK